MPICDRSLQNRGTLSILLMLLKGCNVRIRTVSMFHFIPKIQIYSLEIHFSIATLQCSL